jgi:hypothetical protein
LSCVIISCPLCGTRYRHRVVAGARWSRARCSTCEEVFPLHARRQAYVLSGPLRTEDGRRGPERISPLPDVPVVHALAPAVAAARAGAAGRLAIGMDDPTLASRLSRTTLDREAAPGSPAITYRVAAGAAERMEPSAVSPQVGIPEGHRPVPASWTAAEQPIRSHDSPGASPGGLVMGVVVGGAAGGVLAHWAGVQPHHGMLAGIAVGLFLAAMGPRWKSRRS